jgi:LEA14-like dessication related protein
MSKANAAGNLVFIPGTISDIGVGDADPYMTISVIAQNTSNTSLLLNSFAGNVYANGTLIGNVSNFSGVVVPANTQASIPMQVLLLPLGIVSDLIQAFKNKSTAQSISIQAKANVNGFQVDVPLNFMLNV